MEERKLTQEDIDRGRGVEGFPKGAAEEIIALSDAPYYTACPNPFVREFIQECGSPYDEASDSYRREPFTADVSEGKHDPMYMAHSYHTKVPYRAIMRYILHYTNPGDIVLDGFSGSGMTGVAAQLCGSSGAELRCELLEAVPQAKWGARKAILSDLSTEAAFIGYNFNTPFDMERFTDEAERILGVLREECGWLYETGHSGGAGTGKIEYTVWSDYYICPNCGKELCYWDICVLPGNKLEKFPKCSSCGANIEKSKCSRAVDLVYDEALRATFQTIKSAPVKIFYSWGKKRFAKLPDKGDFERLERIKGISCPYWYPTDELQAGYNTEQPKKSHGLRHVHQFYTKRNLYVLARCRDLISAEKEPRIRNMLMFWFSSIYSRSHKLNRYMPSHNRHVGPLSGTLYVPFFQAEINIISLLEDKLKAVQNVRGMTAGNVLVSTQSATDYRNIPENSVDYIFTDPPFGDNLNYSELNVIWESWLKIKTNSQQEAVINSVQGKGLMEYQSIMSRCFAQYYRVLKPNRWMTVEFHNSKNAVWNAIQESIQRAGFIIADVRTLDKQKGTTKQLSNTSIVQQDLVISCYKPKESFCREIAARAGSEDTAWAFVRQHLANVPVVVDAGQGGRLDIIAERQAFLLWDRMVAYHIMRGLAVPVDAANFYSGLDERFLKRDRMYFLPDQINEYDLARAAQEIENVPLALFVSDEKTAIHWLYQRLDSSAGEGPQTYSELQPKFMQELKAVNRREKMPELLVILEENFLKDEKGRWYIPDLAKSGDIAKLREKNLLKEFREYQASKGRLKVFRSEAVRAGFAKLWEEKNYQGIVAMAERLPEETIQEDSNLLMYYDISLSRV